MTSAVENLTVHHHAARGCGVEHALISMAAQKLLLSKALMLKASRFCDTVRQNARVPPVFHERWTNPAPPNRAIDSSRVVWNAELRHCGDDTLGRDGAHEAQGFWRDCRGATLLRRDLLKPRPAGKSQTAPADAKSAPNGVHWHPSAPLGRGRRHCLIEKVQLPGALDGHVAEWLRSGLQNRLPRFNSGRGLQLSPNSASDPPSWLRRKDWLRRKGWLRPKGWDRSAAAFSAGLRLSMRQRLCYMAVRASRLFPGSSAVEQPAVNRLVAGSNLAWGAKLKQRLKSESGQSKKP